MYIMPLVGRNPSMKLELSTQSICAAFLLDLSLVKITTLGRKEQRPSTIVYSWHTARVFGVGAMRQKRPSADIGGGLNGNTSKCQL